MIGEDLLTAVEELGIDNVKYYDISVLMLSNGNPIGYLHELSGKITIAMPGDWSPADGYSRQFIIIRNHEGNLEVLEEGKDKDYYIENGILYINSDKFSVYAVLYNDTLIPEAPATGAENKVEVSAVVNGMSVVLSVVALIAVLAIAGAVKTTKKEV